MSERKMATLYDFPLDLIDNVAVKHVLTNSNTVSSVLTGYKTYIPNCPSNTDERAIGLIAMMDFFSSLGVMSRQVALNSISTLTCKDKSLAPNYKITNGLGTFPLTAFLGNIKEYYNGTLVKKADAPKPKTPAPTVVVTKPATPVNKIAKTIKVEVNTGAIKIDQSEIEAKIPVLFYFQYKAVKKNKSDADLLLAQRLLVIHERAASRKIDFQMTVAGLRRVFTAARCAYTKLPFSETDPNFYPTLDRVDPNLGYVDGNVVLCSHWANQAKCELLENASSNLKTDLDTLVRFVTNLSKSKFQDKIIATKTV